MRNSGKKARRAQVAQMLQDMGSVPQYGTPRANIKPPQLQPKTYKQEDYLHAMQNKDIVFALGAAGSGKTYMCTHYAAEQLFYKRIDKIYITRPAVEAAGESLGFLPGDLTEKFAPYLVPYMETFNELLGKSFVEYCIKTGTIEPVPLAFMRGRTFKDCIVLGDELENSSPIQMELLLTRIGENCKMFLNGDLRQKDIQGLSGLEDSVSKLAHLNEVEVIQFTVDDVVRSGLSKKVQKAYLS